MKRDSGQVTVFVLGMALVCFAVAGVAADGTRAFLYRRTLQNAADAGALAGASEIDRAAYYEAGGVVIDPAAARRTAVAFLGARGLDADAVVEVRPDEVRVVLRGTIPSTFLRLVLIDELPVAAEARAAPLGGAPD